MDIRKVKKLIELIEETGIAEIEIREGEESIRISRLGTMPAQVMSAPLMHANPPGTHRGSAPAHAENTEAALPAGHPVKAPMVGTFYLSPSPGSEPFVKIGQRVNVGDPLCIIEAMKMFNQIECDRGGVIQAIMVDNNEPVEFGQVLFVIE